MGLGSGGGEVLAPRRRVRLPVAVWLIAAACLVLQFVAAPHYGYFRDELYYLACAKRLAWGYVDQPPLSIALLWGWAKLFGVGLASIRLPVALCYAGTVVSNGAIAWYLANEEPEQKADQAAILCALATATAPVYMVVGHFYAMNGLDLFLSSLLVLAWIRAERNPKLWLVWGVLLGAALLNKWSVLWLLAGMEVGMLVSARRIEMRSVLPWLGLGLAALISAPSFVWQAQNGWPMLEFMANARAHKLNVIPVWTFFGIQLVVMNLVAAPVWIAAFLGPMRRRSLGPMTAPIVAFYVVVLILVGGMKSRPNYASPAYACVLPAGAVLLSRFLDRRPHRRASYLVAIGTAGIVQACFALPILPLPVLKALLVGTLRPPSDERGPKSPLQGHADTLGWNEMAMATQRALEKLPPDIRNQTYVLASNYGEAAALEFNGVPRVICPHNTFWLWGAHGWNGRSTLLVGRSPNYESAFRSVQILDRAAQSDASPEEAGMEIRWASGLKFPVTKFWGRVKRFE